MDKSDALSNKSNRSGRNLHTYTPRSHEDLMRSHLQLDAARKAKLENELQRLAADNERLKRDLDFARQDLQDKEQRIVILTQTVGGKPPPVSDFHQSPPMVVDGKPLTIDYLLHHFNEIIERHHDLLNRKNKYIHDLQNELNRQPSGRRDEPSKPMKPYDQEALQQSLMNEFTNQLTLIRKEYDQVEYILTERNEKLEQLIQALQNKLDTYAGEIQYLRDALANQQPLQPTESTMRLLQDKQKENDHLKEMLSNLKGEQPAYQYHMPLPADGNEALDEQLKKVIENRKIEIDKLSHMINEIKKESPGNIESEPSDLSEVENDCEKMLSDLKNMNDKLTNIITKLKEVPKEVPVQGDTINKTYLISNLENLKKQCEDEIETLKNKLGDKSAPDGVILRGQAVVKIKDPNYPHKKPETEGEMPELPDETQGTPSDIQFILYSTPAYGQPGMRPQRHDEVEPSAQRYVQYKPDSPRPDYSKEPSPLFKHEHYSQVPCEACSDTYVPTSRSVPSALKKPKEPPTSKQTPPSRDKSPKKSPKQKVKTPPSKRKLIDEFYSSSSTKPRPHSKDRSKKGGCCGRKSDSYNEPYMKSLPEEEKLVTVHSPHHVPESTRILYPVTEKEVVYLQNHPHTKRDMPH